MSNLGACNCCEEPPCAAPELEFISVEASCEVCGYALPAHEDLPVEDACLRFAKRTDSRHITWSIDESDATYTVTRTREEISNNVTQKYLDGEGACAQRFFSGSFYETENLTNYEGEELVSDDTVTYNTSAGVDGVWSGTVTISYDPDPGESSGTYPDSSSIEVAHAITNDWTYTSPGVYTISNPTGDETSRTETVTFSEPVTTCEPELPAWPAWEGESEDALLPGQGYTTSAARTASGTCGLTLTLRSVKWRVKHQPSGTCYLKAWIRKTFTPTTGSPTVTNSTYEWTGTGNPCLADPALAVDHADNLIHGSATEETAPETAGVTTFEILKFSCVEGYEPDISDPENPQPNGFPDPTWEAAAP